MQRIEYFQLFSGIYFSTFLNLTRHKSNNIKSNILENWMYHFLKPEKMTPTFCNDFLENSFKFVKVLLFKYPCNWTKININGTLQRIWIAMSLAVFLVPGIVRIFDFEKKKIVLLQLSIYIIMSFRCPYNQIMTQFSIKQLYQNQESALSIKDSFLLTHGRDSNHMF